MIPLTHLDLLTSLPLFGRALPAEPSPPGSGLPSPPAWLHAPHLSKALAAYTRLRHLESLGEEGKRAAWVLARVHVFAGLAGAERAYVEIGAWISGERLPADPGPAPQSRGRRTNKAAHAAKLAAYQSVVREYRERVRVLRGRGWKLYEEARRVWGAL